MGPLFTPPSVVDASGKKGTLILPATVGGGNWQGGAADPETGILYIPSVTSPSTIALVKGGARTDMEWVARMATDAPGPQGLPLVKPPWGRITAIDLNTGDHVWMQPNGAAPESIRQNPALKGIDLSQAGNPERAPLLVTKTLLFSGDGAGLYVAPHGAGGPMFRALDKKTGRTLFEMKLPANETGIPMTYLLNGKQYIVVAVGAVGVPAELVALTLQ